MTRQDLRKKLNELGFGLDYMEAEIEGDITSELLITSTMHRKVFSICYGDGPAELKIHALETFNEIEMEKKKELLKILLEVM